MGGLKGMSELEAMLNFKDKQLQDLRISTDKQIQGYKKQKQQLKEELEFKNE